MNCAPSYRVPVDKRQAPLNSVTPMPITFTRNLFTTSLLLTAIFGISQITKAAQPATKPVASKQRPNILVLMTDDMSRRCVTATGGSQAITPNIDSLARRGTVMQNTVHQGGFSGAICTCSRAMILTGRPLWSVTPDQLSYAGPANLNTADKLFPEQFREEGWQTFGTGKWHNGNAALLRSFDHAEAITGGMLPFNKRDRGGGQGQCNRNRNDESHLPTNCGPRKGREASNQRVEHRRFL